MTKRICLFAGFDKNHIIQDYVVFYVQKMAALADVYYIADCEMTPSEMCKIQPYVKVACGQRHGKYDFGSWQASLALLGDEKLAEYDELILCNDSCYGPMFDLKDVFAKMAARDCDFWSITENWQYNHHLQSYFLVLKRQAFQNQAFSDFMKNVKVEEKYIDIVKNYEVKLTSVLEMQGLKSEAYVKSEIKDNACCYPFMLMKKFQSPFMKIRCFSNPKDNLKGCPWKQRELMEKLSDYDVEMIIRHQGCNPFPRMFKAWLFNLFCNNFILKIKVTKKNKLIVKFLKIPVFVCSIRTSGEMS